jgi:hypothetical protein
MRNHPCNIGRLDPPSRAMCDVVRVLLGAYMSDDVVFFFSVAFMRGIDCGYYRKEPADLF